MTTSTKKPSEMTPAEIEAEISAIQASVQLSPPRSKRTDADREAMSALGSRLGELYAALNGDAGEGG